ncbi:FAD:protein FMN transferase [Alteromonadaceae bacterium BrNp21-10]|nr:FAD:protein FMN transferase [Alteromonadaceae bacterium BrNp21-10]
MMLSSMHCYLPALLLLMSMPLQAQWYQTRAGIMGTNIQVEVWAESPQQGQQALNLVINEMHRIDALMSPYKADSELSKINQLAGQQTVVISSEMLELLQTSQHMSQRTQGAFDITFASIGFLYDYRQQQKPEQQQIKPLLAAIDYRHVQLDIEAKTVFFANPNVKIDLGGIAKGHAVDNAIGLLQQAGIKHALVTAGGDTRLLGDKNGKPWMVGIRDPRNPEREAVVLPLQNIALSTSGDYERYFEQDGQRYHHILSPKSGESPHEVQSVSIIGEQSTLTDGLSTAVFVLGVKAGIDLLNRIPGYEGIIMDNQRKLHYTEALQPNQ